MKRLFDDPALPSDLRVELLRSQRAGREYDVDGKLPQLREAFERTEPVPGETLEPAVGSEVGRFVLANTPLGSIAWKLGLVAVVAGLAAYAVWPESAPAGSAARSAPAEQAPAPKPPASAIVPVPEPIDPAAPQAHAVAAPAPRTDAVVAAPAEGSSRREIAQLVRIRSLLERDPAAAYRLATRGEREFPRGVLSEERRALQVLALAKSGQAPAAERKANEFFARYPQSPMRELVEAALRR